LLTEINTSLVK